MAVSLLTACDNNKIVPDKKNDFTNDDDFNKKPKRNDDDFNEGGGWSSSDKSKFNRECLSGFTEDNQALGRKICPCVLEKYQKKYSNYSEVEAANDEAEVTRIALQCKKQLAGNDDEDNNNDINSDDDNGGGWTKSDERKFVSECAGDASQKVGEERANQYCSCMLDKFKRKYSSYAAASRAISRMTADQINEMAVDCN